MKSSVSSTRKFKNIGTVNLKTGSICKQTMRKCCPNLFTFPPLKSCVSSTRKFKIIGTANLKTGSNCKQTMGKRCPTLFTFPPPLFKVFPLYDQRGSLRDFFTICTSLLEHSFMVKSYGSGGWGGVVAQCILMTAPVPRFGGLGIGDRACQFLFRSLTWTFCTLHRYFAYFLAAKT